MSRQSLFYLCWSLALNQRKNTFFFPCGSSFSYQYVPMLSDVGLKRKSQSHFRSAFGVEVHPAALKDLVWYIWESWITGFRNANNFSTCLFLQNALLTAKLGPVFAFPAWLWWAIQQDILHMIFYWDISLVYVCTPQMMVCTNIHQQAGMLGQSLHPGRPRDVFVLISVERDWIFISLTRLENVHSVSFPYTHIFSFLYRISHLSLSHHSPLFDCS